LGLPLQAGDLALHHSLAGPEADAVEMVAGEHGTHRIRAAGAAQHRIVAGIVALGQRPEHELADRRGIAVWPDLRGDRLMEQGKVLAPQRHFLAEVEPAGVGGLERGDRDPEFADALLREEAGAVPARRPAGVDVAHRDPDHAGKAPAELANPCFQNPLGGRLGRRRDARRDSGRRRRRRTGRRGGSRCRGRRPMGRLGRMGRGKEATEQQCRSEGERLSAPRPESQPVHCPYSPKTFYPNGFTIIRTAFLSA
jgi:hypothetical protein